MKQKLVLLMCVLVIGILAACTKKEEPSTEYVEPEAIAVELTVTETVKANEPVAMKTVVTMGDEKIDDAEEVEYEVWEVGKKDDSWKIKSTNEGEGVYTAETKFEQDGIYEIQVHVTARSQHTMPTKKVVVGDVEAEESTEHEHEHVEGFAMHFMQLEDTKVDEEIELVVHLEMDQAPLEKANVRYEIARASSSAKHDWVDAEEVKAGEYQAAFTFTEAGEYSVVIHVEDDQDLHEHEEYVFEVK